MADYTRREIKKLSPAIIAEFHAAGQAGDEQRFKRLLGQYGAHLPREKKDELIAEFRRLSDALREASRKPK